MEKLIEKFNKTIKPQLKKELKKDNDFQVPTIVKVVVSTGIGDYKEDKNAVEHITQEIARITGQKPKLNLSRKAVSAFKLRIGQPVGLKTTLRGERMFDFLDKLVNVTLPRVRDFRGISANSFDKEGNYTLGIKDYAIFPEVKFEEITIPFGLEVTIRIKAENADDAKALLQKLGFPFKKDEK